VSDRKLYKFIFCLLENLSTYSDPYLALLTPLAMSNLQCFILLFIMHICHACHFYKIFYIFEYKFNSVKILV